MCSSERPAGGAIAAAARSQRDRARRASARLSSICAVTRRRGEGTTSTFWTLLSSDSYVSGVAPARRLEAFCVASVMTPRSRSKLNTSESAMMSRPITPWMRRPSRIERAGTSPRLAGRCRRRSASRAASSQDLGVEARLLACRSRRAGAGPRRCAACGLVTTSSSTIETFASGSIANTNGPLPLTQRRHERAARPRADRRAATVQRSPSRSPAAHRPSNPRASTRARAD